MPASRRPRRTGRRSGVTFAARVAILAGTGIPLHGEADTVGVPVDGDDDDVATFQADESDPHITFEIVRKGGTSKVVEVSYETIDGTAEESLDYTATSGRVMFLSGESTKEIDVPILDDTIDEDDETLHFRIFDADNVDIQVEDAVGYITDDDDPPTLTVSDASAGEYEREILFEVRLAQASGLDVTVSWRTDDGTAKYPSDYEGRTGTYVLSAGDETGQIPIRLINDALQELDEDFTLTITEVVNATVTDATATGTIVDNDAGRVGMSIGDAEVSEGAEHIPFTVTLSAARSSSVSVGYRSVAGRVGEILYSWAGEGNDFVPTSGTLTIPADSRRATIRVSLVDDDEHEYREVFHVELHNPSGAVLEDHLARGSIRDDDLPPLVSISPSFATEPTTTTFSQMPFVFTLDKSSTVPRVINHGTREGTAREGWLTSAHAWDYAGRHGSLTFAPGETSKTVNVPVFGDEIYEGDEWFDFGARGRSGQLDMNGPNGRESRQPVWVRGTIIDNEPVPAVGIVDASGNEADGELRFEAELSVAHTLPVTVEYAMTDGTASAGEDYVSAGGSLSFDSHERHTTLTVTVVDDEIYEGPEKFTVTLNAVDNAVLGRAQATGTIQDDEEPPGLLIRFQGGEETLLEELARHYVVEEDVGTAGFSLAVATTRQADVEVTYGTVAATAEAPGDYTTTTGTLTFAPDSGALSIEVPIIDDVLVEEDETLSVSIRVEDREVVLVGIRIVDDDVEEGDDLARLAVHGAEGSEDAGSLAFRVALEGDIAEAVEVPYATADGSAVAPGDYAARRGTLTFESGTTELTITVPVVDDDVFEQDEEFKVVLDRPDNAAVSSRVATGRILNNDALPSFSVSDVGADEDVGVLGFAVVLDRPSASLATVDYSTADGTALSGEDYDATAGTLTFRPGQTSRAVPVTLNDDPDDEGDETFGLTLSSPRGATLGDASATGTIMDDDTPMLSVENRSVNESQAAARFSIDIRPASRSDLVVALQPEQSRPTTVTANTEYDPAEVRVTIKAGNTHAWGEIPLFDDDVHERTEELHVGLRLVEGDAVVHQGTARARILDDDDPPKLSIGDGRGPESDGRIDFVVALSGNETALEVVITGETRSGTAKQPHDFLPASQRLVFKPGERRKTMSVTVVEDDLYELEEEKFTVELVGDSTAQIGDGDAIGTIIDSDPPPVLTLDDARALEREDSMKFVVRLTPPTDSDLEIFHTTTDATAEGGLDYVVSNGSVTFEAGHREQEIRVPLLDDDFEEPDETFGLAVEPRYISVGDTPVVDVERAAATGTIVDDDDGDGASVSVGSATAREGGELAFELSLSEPATSEISVAYATSEDTAAAGTDYVAVSGRATFAPDVVRLTVSVAVVDDEVPEPREVMALKLSDVRGARIAGSRGLGTILDDDGGTVDIAVGSGPVVEGAPAVFELTWSGDASSEREVVVDVAVEGDYLSGTPPAAVMFRPNQVTTLLRVLTDNDLRDEPNGSVVVTVVANTDYRPGQAMATTVVMDDDDRGVDVRPTTLSVREGGRSGYEVRLRSEPWGSGPVRVSVSVPADTDLSAETAELTFRAADWNLPQRVGLLAAEDDDLLEDDPVRVSHGVRGADYDGVTAVPVTATIVENDVPTLWIVDRTASEGDGRMVFTANLSVAPAEAATVDYATADGTARAGGDYGASAGTLTFAIGETSTAIPVTLVDDAAAEDDEAFTLRLSNPRGAVIADGEAIGTILDDDGGDDEAVTLTVADASGPEGGGSLAFTVRLSAVAEQSVTVSYATSHDADADNPASVERDYESVVGTLTLAAGQRQQTVKVFLVDDVFTETDETFSLVLSNPRGAEIADAEATGTIEDDDRAALGVLQGVSVSSAVAAEGAGSLAFELVLAARTGRDVSVDFATSDGTALAGEDYVAMSGTLTFATGERRRTVEVELVDDAESEPEETFAFVLSNPGGLWIRHGEVTGTIRDDDGGAEVGDIVVALGERRTVGLPPTDKGDGLKRGSSGNNAYSAPHSAYQAEAEGNAVKLTVEGDSLVVEAAAVGVSQVRVIEAGVTRQTFAVTVQARAIAGRTLGDVELDLDDPPLSRDLASRFRGSSLRFTAATSDPGVVSARVQGTRLVLTPVVAGVATVTVTADNAVGIASQAFATKVVDRRRDPAIDAALAAIGRSVFASVVRGIEQRVTESGVSRATVTDGRPGHSTDLRAAASTSSASPFGLGIADLRFSEFGFAARPGPSQKPTVSFSVEAGGAWTLWGWSDANRFVTEGGEGDTASLMFGIDTFVGDGSLAGISVARSTAEMHYPLEWSSAVCPEWVGALRTDITSVHPYARLPMGRGLLWLAVGAGRGDASLRQCSHDVGASAGVSMAMAAIGGRHPIGHGPGPVDWAIMQDAGWLRFATHGHHDNVLAERSILVGRMRLGLEAVLDLEPLAATFTTALRHDDGAGISGTGLELATGVHYRDAASRLSVEAEGRVLAARSARSLARYGFTVGAGYRPRTDGTGLSIALTSGVGLKDASSRELWDGALPWTELAPGAAQVPQVDRGSTFGLQFGYGRFGPLGGVVTPFADVDFRGNRAGTRFGARYQVNAGTESLDAELVAGHGTGHGGGSGSFARLDLRVRF